MYPNPWYLEVYKNNKLLRQYTAGEWVLPLPRRGELVSLYMSGQDLRYEILDVEYFPLYGKVRLEVRDET